MLLVECRFVSSDSLEHEINLTVIECLPRSKERVGSRCKCFLSNTIAAISSERLEEEECRFTVCKLNLQEVLQLNHEVLVLSESLESIDPVLDREESFLVWVDLSEELLLEHISQVKTSQSIMLVDKGDELDMIYLVCLSRCIVERLFQTIVNFRDLKSNLLNSSKLPVNTARSIETTSHRVCENALCLASCSANVRTNIIYQSLEI